VLTLFLLAEVMGIPVVDEPCDSLLSLNCAWPISWEYAFLFRGLLFLKEKTLRVRMPVALSAPIPGGFLSVLLEMVFSFFLFFFFLGGGER